MKHLYITSFLLFVTLCTYAESSKTVKVRGEYYLSDNEDITIKQAKQLAKEDAMRKALEEVCGQYVSIFEQVESSTKVGEVFTSITSIEVNGEISKINIIKEDKELRGSFTLYYCEASVTVKKGIKPDKSFTAQIWGLDKVYYEEGLMTFLVEPTIDCYLNIFVYEDPGEVNRLYPNKREPSNKLKAYERVEFPIPDDVEGYNMSKETDKPTEVNKIVFLFTKDECEPPGFRHKESADKVNDLYFNRDELREWIYSIPSDRRFIYTTTFEIKKKR